MTGPKQVSVIHTNDSAADRCMAGVSELEWGVGPSGLHWVDCNSPEIDAM